MSKKKIISIGLIVILLIFLVCFFWPKRFFEWSGTGPNIELDCKCLGIKYDPNKHKMLEGGSVGYCYGIVYDCIRGYNFFK